MITILKLTRGSVSARTGVDGNAQARQNTAPLQSGNSGLGIVGQNGKGLGADVGQAALCALQELPTADGKPATQGFLKWRKKQKPRTKTVHARHNKGDTDT
jgi:hypothetical protein